MLRSGADPNELADRARHLVEVWRLRPQDGFDAAQVIDAAGKQITRFTVEIQPTWSNGFSGKRSIGRQHEEV